MTNVTYVVSAIHLLVIVCQSFNIYSVPKLTSSSNSIRAITSGQLSAYRQLDVANVFPAIHQGLNSRVRKIFTALTSSLKKSVPFTTAITAVVLSHLPFLCCKAINDSIVHLSYCGSIVFGLLMGTFLFFMRNKQLRHLNFRRFACEGELFLHYLSMHI